jgi:hypothetical protein
MSNEQLPEHKELAAALRLAKAKRVEAQQKMFAVNKPRACMGVEPTSAWLKASERERELASQLAQLRYDSQVQLGEMVQAANAAGAKLDHKRVQELNTIITESWNDLMSV